MTTADKLQAIYNTGMPDSAACLRIGCSKTHYMRMKTDGKTANGHSIIVKEEMAKRIDALYEERKNMPPKAVLSGWRKENLVKRYVNGVWHD